MTDKEKARFAPTLNHSDPDWDKLTTWGAGGLPATGNTGWQMEPGTYPYEVFIKQSLFSPWRVDRDNCTDYILKNIKLPAYYGFVLGAAKTSLDYMNLEFESRDKLVGQYWRKGFKTAIGKSAQFALAFGTYCAARCMYEKVDQRHSSVSGVYASIAAGALVGAKKGLGTMGRISISFIVASWACDLANWGLPHTLQNVTYYDLPKNKDFWPKYYLQSMDYDPPKDIAATYLEERYAHLNEEGLRRRIGFDHLRK